MHDHEHTDGVDAPTIEMPRPTVWPMIVSFGLFLMAFGASVESRPFIVVGGVLFVLGLWNWLGSLVAGTALIREPLLAPTRHPIQARIGTIDQPGPSRLRPRLPQKIYPVRIGLWGGLAGGLVMPIPAEAWGLLSGHGIWFPVNLLAGLVLPGVDKHPVAELEQFRPGLLAIGIAIHVAMSAVIGLMYGVLLPLTPGKTISHLVFGGLIIPLMWTGVSGALMGVANPILQHYVNWYWFAASQMVFGLTAAIVVVRSDKVDVPPAGQHELHDSLGERP